MRSSRITLLVIIAGLCQINPATSLAVCPGADLTGDCFVDMADFSLIVDMAGFVIIASQWLTSGVPDPNGMEWVYIDNDLGVSGHEGFNGYMSKYETTNAQYCQFLNAALADGDITVRDNIVFGANGSNSGADFVGEVYYYLEGLGLTFNGATNGGAARIHYSDGTFTVDSGFDDHPVTYVSWYGSSAFCNYYGLRLPTQWEWQAVADYDGNYLYGCGIILKSCFANINKSTHPDGTTPVGTFAEALYHGYGMCDMAGNAYEWTDSTYSGSYRVLLGGGWDFKNYRWILLIRY